jgi:hypothetical protein
MSLTSQLPTHWIGAEVGYRQRGIPLSDALVSLDSHDLALPAIFLGSAGSGKTNLLHQMLAGDIINGRNIILVDPNGDLVSDALELVEGRVAPSRIALIDFHESEFPTGYCPLSGSGEPFHRALGVYDAIAASSPSWGIQLGDTLLHGLFALAETGHRLTDLEALLYDAHFRQEVLDELNR